MLPRSSRCRKLPANGTRIEITAQGPHLVVVFNGVKTVDVQDSKHDKGVIALQHGVGADKKEGAIKFRKVEIKPL